MHSSLLMELNAWAEGLWAEVKLGNEHIQLLAEHNAQGVQASVYNVNAKN